MTLPEIAQALRSAARVTGGPAQHRLSRGLTLTLQHNQGQWTLSLTRHKSTPSPTEERLTRQAFGVPRATRRLHKKNDYHIIRLAWKEATPGEAEPEAPKQLEMAGMAGKREEYYRE
jgi:hypothetical protein